jgi:ankyrin repeat protein
VDTHLLIANFQDANEQLPLHRASAPGHFDCVETLIHEGYSLLDGPDFDGNAALHLGVLTLEEKHAAKIARIILEARGDVNLRNAQQCTALHLVASGSRAQVVLVLLHHAADVTVTEVLRGRTPLHLAASAGARDVCIQLLEARADVKAGSRDAAGTPLTCAAPSCLEVLSAAMQRREYGTYYWRRDMLAN